MGSIKSTNLLARRNRPPEGEAWVWHTRELIESDAWRTAPIHTKRFVDLLELEWMAHAGRENGRLICTYDDCVAFGIGRRFINRAIRDAVSRGLVYRSECGGLSAGGIKKSSRYGLGWLPAHDGAAAPNRWKLYRSSLGPTPGKSKKQFTMGVPGRVGKNGGNASGKSARVHHGCTGRLQKGALGKMNFGKGNLPPGWRTGRADDGHVRILRPDGVGVPVVDDSLVGSGRQREALTELNAWQAAGTVTGSS